MIHIICKSPKPAQQPGSFCAFLPFFFKLVHMFLYVIELIREILHNSIACYMVEGGNDPVTQTIYGKSTFFVEVTKFFAGELLVVPPFLQLVAGGG